MIKSLTVVKFWGGFFVIATFWAAQYRRAAFSESQDQTPPPNQILPPTCQSNPVHIKSTHEGITTPRPDWRPCFGRGPTPDPLARDTPAPQRPHRATAFMLSFLRCVNCPLSCVCRHCGFLSFRMSKKDNLPTCDVCQTHIGKGTKFYHCFACPLDPGFDVCKKCYGPRVHSVHHPDIDSGIFPKFNPYMSSDLNDSE